MGHYPSALSSAHFDFLRLPSRESGDIGHAHGGIVALSAFLDWYPLECCCGSEKPNWPA